MCAMVVNRNCGMNKKMLKNIYNSTLYEITTKCEHIKVGKRKKVTYIPPTWEIQMVC